MGLSHSPKIVTNGLVFAYDMGNTNKSWKGEPTTNILPSPAINGRFTTSNGWGTFNGNQYNNNQYFSIGTIASVTSNIVTTTTAHPLRTFDAVQPQTTGGGVTAGTVYFIKKISSTQFSLHAYNSTENGSQGFINPSTGFHKVHDSIALDQRITINSTNFPTMWWGPPHVPNSAIVKEVKDGVGPQGQSVMRLHIHRTDNVVDGMAYGVYTPVNIGDVINVSYWMRTSYPGKTILYTTYFGANISAYNRTDTATSDWVRVSHQWTSLATFSFYQYWFPAASVDVPYWIDICDLQVEVNTQSGDTPFVAGTRSNTQAILDWTGLNAVTATSLTYNNDNTFSFNGTSNAIDLGNGVNLQQSTAITMSAWINPVSASGLGNIMSKNYNAAYRFRIDSVANALWWYVSGNYIQGGQCPNNVWSHCTVTGDSSGLKAYVNGQLVASNSTAFSPTSPATGNLFIGMVGGGEYFNGRIANASMYSRALTASEVLQNFNALRGRFGI